MKIAIVSLLVVSVFVGVAIASSKSSKIRDHITSISRGDPT